MIDRLPRASHYKAALAQDDELAEKVLARGKPKAAAPSLVDWTPEVDMLARVVDELRAVVSILIKANSKKGKGPDPKPVRRPRTAMDRAQKRQAEERYRGLVARLLPWKEG